MDALLRELIVFSAQLLVIVGVAAIAEALGRVTDARLRLTFWRGVALACLALPLSALFGSEALGSGVRSLGFGVSLNLASAASAPTAAVPAFLAAALAAFSALGALVARVADAAHVAQAASSDAIWSVLCGGALLRLGWLCAGAVRLRQLRKRSRSAVLTSDLEAMREEIAPRTAVRVSCETTQPAGFGLRRPIVLLPERFFTMDPEAQRTVMCHELLHVARRDWPWIVVEEAARALFWFHPAAWWLVERIQESREQLVDRLVIARIPSKRAYMTALVAFADGARGRTATVTPATAFLRRRHLRSRLRKLAKESVMSRTRFVWTAVVLGIVMAGAIAGTVMALPLGGQMAQAAADSADSQEVVDGKAPGVTLPTVTSEVRPEYTPEALKARIQGTLILSVVVRTDGTPDDIEVTTSLDKEYGLDNQAVAAIEKWRFEPGLKDGKPVPVRVDIEVRFRLGE